MTTIQVFTLQQPRIMLDGNPIVFPYKKAEALFYYIAVEKAVSRDVISSLLWEDSDTETARKNLRHALYILKKTFGLDVVTSSHKFNLILSPEVELLCDTDSFFQKNDMKVYQAEFLCDFSVKKADAFDDWIEQKRESIRNLYLIKFYDYICSLPYSQLSEIELSCSSFMQADPFDERVVFTLLKAYQANKLYLKGIKVYQKLHKELGEELGIVPGAEITELYKQLRVEWAETSAMEDSEESLLIKARTKEALILKNVYQQFKNGKVTSTILTGENGVGKTFLVQSFFESIAEDDILKISTFCFSQESHTTLYPWNSIILRLDEYIQTHKLEIPQAVIQSIAQFFPTFGNQPILNTRIPLDLANSFTMRAVQNAIFRILAQITEQIPVLLLFENLQFADSATLQLISLLLRNMKEHFMIIFTTLNIPHPEILAFTSALQKEHLLSHLQLNCFSKEDMLEVISSSLDIKELDTDTIDKIYEETSGNAFFLNELLITYKERGEINALSLNAKTILAQRLIGLSTQACQILDIISLFHDYASLDLLETILDGNSLDTLESLESLKMRALIKESLVQGQIRFTFTHSKMREYVHSLIPPSKQKVLYNSVACALEKILLPSSPDYYNKLVHYFTLAGNSIKVLMYQIYPFENTSISMFELYPSQMTDNNLTVPENVTQYFEEIENRLAEFKHQFTDMQLYEKLKAHLLIAKGRYYILSGLYCDGLVCIKNSLQLNYIKEHPEHHLRALRQMVYYGIQLYQPSLMKTHINTGLAIAEEHDLWLEYALFLRLNGLYYLFIQKFDDCYDNLMHSISLLESHSIQNGTTILNTSVAYNYLGEMERRQNHFEKALDYYLLAVKLCEQHNLSINPTYYTNIGCAYLGLNQSQKAYAYFLSASELYDNTFTLMGRSIAKGNCAIYYSEQQNFELAKKLLNQAQEAANRLGSPLEKGLLRQTQANLLTLFPAEYSSFFTEPLSFYIQDSKRLLMPLNL